MSKSHVVGWGSDSPTPAQLKEFMDQTASGRIKRERLQGFLNEKGCRLTALTLLTVASNTINPHDFFKNREGLWTSKEFNDFILSGASKKKVLADETTIGYAKLIQAANNSEIGGELSENYVFEDVDTFLVCFATLIHGQWGGKSDTLINDSFSNIFYVKVNGEVFTADVRWRFEDRDWFCDAGRLDGVWWIMGNRAFSAIAA